MTTRIAGALAAATTLALLVGFAAPAQAAPAEASPTRSAQSEPTVTIPDTLPAIQAAGARATADRIAALNRTIPAITRNGCITDAHRETILNTLSTTLDAVTSLRDEIAAATDVPAAAAAYRSVLEDWRVYGVVIPQSRYAAAADCLESKAIPALETAQSKLQAAIDGPRADRVTPEIEAQMAELATQIEAAKSAVTGLADTALAVTAADFNADRAVLSDVKVSLSTAVSAARLARTAAHDVAQALR
jgi:hypothetical protein